MQFTIIGQIEFGVPLEEQDVTISIFIPGRTPTVVHSSHPRFRDIYEGVLRGDEKVVGLADLRQYVTERFEQLSSRVTLKGTTVYFDDVAQDSSISDFIVRCVEDATGDWYPIVRFLENVAANPSDNSRVQLWSWVRTNQITLTQDGYLVGYKGTKVHPDGTITSVNEGTAIVNGQTYSGQIPNFIGAVVEMPRDQVEDNPRQACSVGLHVGTFGYAGDWNQGAMLEVHVNPADVVSVPNDGDGHKIRVCRYSVVGVIEAEYKQPILVSEEQKVVDRYEFYFGPSRADVVYDEVYGDPDDEDFDGHYEEMECDNCGNPGGSDLNENFLCETCAEEDEYDDDEDDDERDFIIIQYGEDADDYDVWFSPASG